MQTELESFWFSGFICTYCLVSYLLNAIEGPDQKLCSFSALIGNFWIGPNSLKIVQCFPGGWEIGPHLGTWSIWPLMLSPKIKYYSIF